MLRRTYRTLMKAPLVGAPLRRLRYPVRRLLHYHLDSRVKEWWKERIQEVRASPDNAYIPRVRHAGKLRKGFVIMHNGLRVHPESFYGEPMRYLLEKNGGVHEPQEERVFQEVLERLPSEAVMVELGAYWGFYSMWFHQRVETPTCILVEPNLRNMEWGRKNFEVNGMRGTFVRASVGEGNEPVEEGAPVVTVEALMTEHDLDRIHLLHADVQGAEMEVLRGAEGAMVGRKIDYLFLSTHGEELHLECRAFVEKLGYLVLADAGIGTTFSVDGLIVARRREMEGLDPIAISQRTEPGARQPVPDASQPVKVSST